MELEICKRCGGSGTTDGSKFPVCSGSERRDLIPHREPEQQMTRKDVETYLRWGKVEYDKQIREAAKREEREKVLDAVKIELQKVKDELAGYTEKQDADEMTSEDWEEVDKLRGWKGAFEWVESLRQGETR